MNIFEKTHEVIEAHNAKNETWTMGHNFMSTWTEAEKKKLNGALPPTEPRGEEEFIPEVPSNGSIDWRSQGKVNASKNQAQCGSCWAFSAVASTETAHAIKSGQLLSLSEEQLVQCSTGNYGCNGGWPSHAFQYLQTTSLNTEGAYPYTSGGG